MLITRICIAAFLVILSLGFWCCNSEVDILTDDYQTIPVIIALINPWDSVHSVRVQRSFLIRDKEGAKLQDSDSLFFEQVDVRLSGLVGDQEIFSYNFLKTALDKDTGIFTGVNHHIYQLTQKLPINVSGQSTYSSGRPDIDFLALEVYIYDLDTMISHRIPVYAPVHIYNQPWPYKVVIYGDYLTSFHCNSNSRVGSSLVTGELEFRFNISEFGEGFGYDTVYKYKVVTPPSYRFDKPEKLLNKILMSLDLSRDSIRTRVFHTMDLYWTLTEPAFQEYNRILAYWQGMIDYPYSQIPGMYGFMVTKVDGKLEDLELDMRAMDSLCNGVAYKYLNFRSW